MESKDPTWNRKEKGFFLILVGLFMLVSSIVISDGFRPNLPFITNVQIGEIVISQGEYVRSKGSDLTGNYEPSYYKDHVAIKTSHAVIFSFATLLLGVWFLRKS